MADASKNTQLAVIDAFAGQSVVVLGDVMLDEYIHGDVSRISPEAPVPVLEIRRRLFRPGGAANAAANVASLGGRPSLIGVVGTDDAARTLVEILGAEGVATRSFVAVEGRPTTSKTRVVARGQQVVRLDHEAKALLSREEEDRLVAAVEQELAAGATACIVSDYAKGVVSERVAQAVVAAAKRAGRPVVADPKSRSFTKYRGATMVTPNTHELELAVGRSAVVSDDEVVAAAGELLPELAGSSLLVTRGARGMSLFAPGTPALHLPTMAKAVYDVVGAGDTVVSTLALALAVGAPFDVAVRLANLAAGLAVSKPGTATVSQGELRAAAVHD